MSGLVHQYRCGVGNADEENSARVPRWHNDHIDSPVVAELGGVLGCSFRTLFSEACHLDRGAREPSGQDHT